MSESSGGLSSAKLLSVILEANKTAQQSWKEPVCDYIPASFLSCSTSMYKLADLFGRDQFLHNIRVPMSSLDAYTTEALLLTAYVHKDLGVNLVAQVASPHPGGFHPTAISTHIGNDANIVSTQREYWHKLKESTLMRGVLIAKLNINPANMQLSIHSLWLDSERVGGQRDNYSIREFGRKIREAYDPSVRLSQTGALAYLLHKNQTLSRDRLHYDKNRNCRWPTRCAWIQCIDARTSLYGDNSYLGQLPVRMHRVRIPGGAIPSSYLDSLISVIIEDQIPLVVLATHDDTCVICELSKDHPNLISNLCPNLLGALQSREETWAALLEHPLVAKRIEEGKLGAARIHMDIHTGALNLLNYHGAESHLLDSWVVAH